MTDSFSHYGITPKCNITYADKTNHSITAIGDIRKGEFEGDPDIAGVGVRSTQATLIHRVMIRLTLAIDLRHFHGRVFSGGTLFDCRPDLQVREMVAEPEGQAQVSRGFQPKHFS